MGSILRYTIAALAVAGLGAVAGHQLGAARAAQSPEPGPIEVGFAQFMSLHHQQAIGMAKLMLDGRPTALAATAQAIADAQLVELGEMRGWLRLWDRPLVPKTRSMDWMLLGKAPPDAALAQYLLDCRNSPTGMSGLATDAEINRLRQLEGGTRDQHFLALMLAHHEGGVPMARFGAQEARVPVVRQLAARVVVDQSEEISRMRRMQQVLAAIDAGASEADQH